jgi:long-chain fatty acid transport protein
VEPKLGTRFGLTYLTEVKLDFSATPEFSGLGPGLEALLRARGLTTASMDLSMTVPQMVMFSAYHEMSEKWAVMANLGWQDWSRFGKVDVSVNTADPRSLTADNDYNDTWHVALGAQYRYSPQWTFTGGICHDTSAVDDDKRTLSVPIGEIWGFSIGAQYTINPNLTLGVAYEFAWLGDMPVTQDRPGAGRVSGEFSDTTFNFFALNLKWTY